MGPASAICLHWLGESILSQATKNQTCPFSGRPYVEDTTIQGVKILLSGDWPSSLERCPPRQLSRQLKKIEFTYYRVFRNDLIYFGSLECQQNQFMGLKKVWAFGFLPLE